MYHQHSGSLKPALPKEGWVAKIVTAPNPETRQVSLFDESPNQQTKTLPGQCSSKAQFLFEHVNTS